MARINSRPRDILLDMTDAQKLAKVGRAKAKDRWIWQRRMYCFPPMNVMPLSTRCHLGFQPNEAQEWMSGHVEVAAVS